MFEEWYFNKLEGDLKKKSTAQAEEEAKLYALEMERIEKKENAVIEYEKWLREKNEQMLKVTRRKQRKDANKEKVGYMRQNNTVCIVVLLVDIRL